MTTRTLNNTVCIISYSAILLKKKHYNTVDFIGETKNSKSLIAKSIKLHDYITILTLQYLKAVITLKMIFQCMVMLTKPFGLLITLKM